MGKIIERMAEMGRTGDHSRDTELLLAGGVVMGIMEDFRLGEELDESESDLDTYFGIRERIEDAVLRGFDVGRFLVEKAQLNEEDSRKVTISLYG